MKPELFVHEDLFEAEKQTGMPLRVAFIGLFTCCDREGRFKWRPRTLKLAVLPHDEVDFSRVLDALTTRGFLVKYASESGEEIGMIPTFTKHQVINNRETPSDLPPPPPDLEMTAVPTRTPTRESRVDDASGTRAQGKGREGKGKEGKEEANASVENSGAPSSFDLAGEVPSKSLMCPVQRIVDAYHELMPDNPKVRNLNDTRRKLIAARWKEAARMKCRPFGYETVEAGMAAWRKFFAVCAQSEFLTGKSKPQPGKPPFLADIDWIINAANFTKILENKYHREAA